MANNAVITLIPGSLPAGYCFSTLQQLYIDFVRLTSGFMPGTYNTFNYGIGPVAAEDRDKPWFRLNGDGSPDKWYVYFNGSWSAPYRVPASSDERMLWVGDLTALESYDGGSPGAVTASTGPFWEEDTDFQGRSPMHPGAIPTSNPAKTLAIDENFGEGAHTQTGQEVGPHTHPFSHPRVEGSGSTDITGSDVIQGDVGTGPQSGTASALTNTYTTTQQAMPVIHPVRGIYICKRTARTLWTV